MNLAVCYCGAFGAGLAMEWTVKNASGSHWWGSAAGLFTFVSLFIVITIGIAIVDAIEDLKLKR